MQQAAVVIILISSVVYTVYKIVYFFIHGQEDVCSSCSAGCKTKIKDKRAYLSLKLL